MKNFSTIVSGKYSKLLVGLLIYTVIATPLTAQAVSTAELQLQIQNLLTIVTKLQQQLVLKRLNTTRANILCENFKNDLSLGKRDSDTFGEVSRLQLFLTKTKDYNGTVGGYFGPLTESAVKKWQSRNGVVANGTPRSTGFGVIGPKTRRAMHCQGKRIIFKKPAISTIIKKKAIQNIDKKDGILQLISDSEMTGVSLYSIDAAQKKSRESYGSNSECGYSFEYPSYLELIKKDKKCFDGKGGPKFRIKSQSSSLSSILDIRFKTEDSTTFDSEISRLKKFSENRGISVKKQKSTKYFDELYVVDGMLFSIMGNSTYMHSLAAHPRGLDDKAVFIVSSAYSTGLGAGKKFDVVCTKHKKVCALGDNMSKELVKTILDSIEIKPNILKSKLNSMKKMHAANLESARGKARDARRSADIKVLQIALESYYDGHSAYPHNLTNRQSALDVLVSDGHIVRLPIDPLTHKQYQYSPINNGKEYVLSAVLEHDTNPVFKYDLDGDIQTDHGVHHCGPANGAYDTVYCVGQ